MQEALWSRYQQGMQYFSSLKGLKSLKACEEMTDNKLVTWRYIKQARTRASNMHWMTAFTLSHGLSPASSGSNQKLVLLCCYFAFAMCHATEHSRAGKNPEVPKRVRNIFFSSLSSSKTLSFVQQIHLTEGPLSLHTLLCQLPPDKIEQPGKSFSFKYCMTISR